MCGLPYWLQCDNCTCGYKERPYQPTAEERERRLRIQVTMAANAYEMEDCQFMDDAMYDISCRRIIPKVSTNHPVLDKFFREEFTPYTGMWIWQHPELDKVAALFNQHYKERCK